MILIRRKTARNSISSNDNNSEADVYFSEEEEFSDYECEDSNTYEYYTTSITIAVTIAIVIVRG